MKPTLNLEYVNARKLKLPSVEKISLVLIGCGGTGSWLAPAVVRYARMLTEKFDREVQTIFIDPDKVEPKNCYRQNFCEAEIGSFKAQALAFRYGLAWGMPVLAINEPFKASLNLPDFRNSSSLRILIGSVDNTKARKEIETQVMRYNVGREISWWLDCGNKKDSGQVLLGRAFADGEDPLVFGGYATWLPLPSTQHPELVGDFELADDQEEPEDENLSCAELVMRGSQSLSINFRVAAAAGEMLGKMLLTQDLEYYAAYLGHAGETRKFITGEAIQPYMPAPDGLPKAEPDEDDPEFNDDGNIDEDEA